MELTIAGKRFEVRGVTAVPAPSADELDLRLTSDPRGCSMFLDTDVGVVFRVGGAAPPLNVEGRLLSGGLFADIGADLRLDARRSGDVVDVTIDGRTDYNVDGRPGARPYTLEVKGSFTVPVCAPTR